MEGKRKYIIDRSALIAHFLPNSMDKYLNFQLGFATYVQLNLNAERLENQPQNLITSRIYLIVNFTR